MKFLPFAGTILWKSWANRAAAFGGVLAAACGALHGFDAMYPSVWGDKSEYVLAAAAAFFGIVVAPVLRVVSQNFGTDASGNQIVGAIGTAPAGTSPTPPVVVAMPDPKTPQIAPTTTPEVTQAVVGK